MTRKPLICLDVDNTVHGYQSGWVSADRMPDPPVPGAMEAIRTYLGSFRVALFSARTGQPGGVGAMQHWLRMHMVAAFGADEGRNLADQVEWPSSKPPAFVTIDDRALTFTGKWPSVEELRGFKTWDKREPVDEDEMHDAVSGAVMATHGPDIAWERDDARAFLWHLNERGYRIVKGRR